MDNPDLKPKLDAVVPGVVDAYTRLKSHDGMGIHTSSGHFYNHTLFGRDGSMSAKFVADFDHEVASEVILALAALQGTEYNPLTHEEPGRIHHELRDFTTWKGNLVERLGFWFLRSKWDIRHQQLLTYFSQDTTAAYIRMVHKYATHIDASILDRRITNHHGDAVTIATSVERAAQWIVENIDERNLLVETRKNGWSLPFQTFQDSLYARADGAIADYTGDLGYVEVQAFAADALQDAARLMSEHSNAKVWRETASQMHHALLRHYWNEDVRYFASCLDSRGQIDVRNVSSGWIFNSSLWTDMSSKDQARYIAPVVERLFSEEFLTPVGLRTRSKDQASPLHGTVAYHDRETVWPMFTFMVIEGLRRHRLYGLAEQLENRIINGLNATGTFDEFFVVDTDGHVLLETVDGPTKTVDIQMKPEHFIAFSVVPAMVIAKRASYKNESLKQVAWQKTLEKKILDSIPHIERAVSADAQTAIGPVAPARFRRFRAAYRTARYLRSLKATQ